MRQVTEKTNSQIEKQRKGNIFDPESLLEALNLQPTEATTPPSLMDKLLEPIVGPLKKGFNKAKVSTAENSVLIANTVLFRPLMTVCSQTAPSPTRR